MSTCNAKERGIGRRSAHNSSPIKVLQRSKRLTKDEMILRLGDGKAIAAETVGSIEFAISHHIKPSFLNMTPSKKISQMPYEIWHDKPASYKYLKVWGSPAYVKRLVEDKLDSRSSLCRFIGYPKETVGYYFYALSKKKVFVSCSVLEESSEVFHETSETASGPIVPTNSVPVLRRSARVTQPPERFGFVGLTSQLDNDLKMYGEVMSDIHSDKWLKVMKSKMDSIGSNQVWTLVGPPKGVKARLVAKG
ncbi:UNVERIFIED_CONTAM: hypothetical protein Slati_3939100 [Sesamum latifolium]|uniref:Retroviral polymerase SH3-like domain-containing protein n=1 Tax=Sesamum latifolium TaxID=2727402 RepID=A0AAW2TPL0_9LAMI